MKIQSCGKGNAALIHMSNFAHSKIKRNKFFWTFFAILHSQTQLFCLFFFKPKIFAQGIFLMLRNGFSLKWAISYGDKPKFEFRTLFDQDFIYLLPLLPLHRQPLKEKCRPAVAPPILLAESAIIIDRLMPIGSRELTNDENFYGTNTNHFCTNN